LPWDHADPFDRIIVATANFHKLKIITSDAAIAGQHCLW
jgi:PIN domain nuclease of toxin-antitoxin system